MHRLIIMCQNIRDPSLFFFYFCISSDARSTLTWQRKYEGKEKTQKHQTTTATISFRLDVGVVGERSDGLRSAVLKVDNVRVARLDGLSLQVQVDALLLGLALLGGILLDAGEEVITGTGVGNVLDADADAFLDVAVADPLVQKNPDGGLGDVVHNTGAAVVELVRQTVKELFSQQFVHGFHPENSTQ